LRFWEGRFPDHWRTGQVRSQLGEVETVRGHYPEAEALLLAAASAFDTHVRETGGPGPELGRRRNLERLVYLYEQWKKPTDAARWRERLRAPKEQSGWNPFR
jgi:hypothetical protein